MCIYSAGSCMPICTGLCAKRQNIRLLPLKPWEFVWAITDRSNWQSADRMRLKLTEDANWFTIAMKEVEEGRRRQWIA